MTTASEESHAPKSAHGHGHGSTWALMLAALGIVYGDIGTSPLYAIKECFSPESTHRVETTPENVLGVLSLVFWSLTMVVTVKYLMFVMRADNEGQGGILALLALVPPKNGKRDGRPILLPLVLFGAALLYGDGVITPAISVLSAVEGLQEAATSLKPVIVPLTCGILIGLFLVQKRGTGGVGAVFGPLMVVWFLTLSVLGVKAIVQNPAIFKAISPTYAVEFFAHNKGHGFLILGSVVLCITGGEALYADMGHFGRSPIRRSWFLMVFPALLINYFGQGANLLQNPAAAKNPFYALVPGWALYPVIAIATCATVIASQALISGAFSLTQQAVQLGYFPRVTIVHTSKESEGQIYIPEVNWALLVACIALVLQFGSSSKLAAAYGIAVTGTMGITTVVYFVVITERWKWPMWKAVPLLILFMFFDIGYFAANAAKLHDGIGGWAPLIMGSVVFTVMTTWKTGRAALYAFIKEAALPLQIFLDDIENQKLHRVRGTAVFMSSNPDATPPVLLHHVKHNKVLHEQLVLLSIHSERVPEVPIERRVEVVDKGQGVFQVVARYGFMQTPNVPSVMESCKKYGIHYEVNTTSYYLGRETLLTSGKAKMSRWRKGLFAFISRNARPATAYFGLPPNRVVELGMQVDL
ncbi:MAG: potassium transporter Kup [Polyangiaceae bacterium]|nr:potassium transporter Kup [Polyangiaceae bacterium]